MTDDLRHLTPAQAAARDVYLARMVARIDAGNGNRVCSCCGRPPQSGMEYVGRLLSDPARLRAFNALFALAETEG